ncbi:hypothetical protein DFH06DRAFT_1131045 [Mycena polygramma]|nr:hypothetical protein DFH06DRAFT_1131045 [Mycena polygramma]
MLRNATPQPMSATNRSGQKGLAAAHDLVAFPVVFATALARGESGAQETGPPTRESRESKHSSQAVTRAIRRERARQRGLGAGVAACARHLPAEGIWATERKRQDAAAFRPPGCGTTRRRLAVYGETWRDDRSNGSNLPDVEREERGCQQGRPEWNGMEAEADRVGGRQVDGRRPMVNPSRPRFADPTSADPAEADRPRQTDVNPGKQALPTGARNAVFHAGKIPLRAAISLATGPRVFPFNHIFVVVLSPSSRKTRFIIACITLLTARDQHTPSHLSILYRATEC